MRRPASLTMLLLLALRVGATDPPDPLDPPGTPGACTSDRRRPTLTATTATTRSFKTYSGQALVSPSGEDLTIYCSGDDSTELEVEQNGPASSVRLNSSTISVSVSQPGIGEYTYRCTDRAARCFSILTVTVAPSISLISSQDSQARHKIDDYGTLTYFVPRGEGYDIFCRGNDVKDLRVEYRSSGVESSGELRTSVRGPAGVRHAVQTEGREGARLYTCTHKSLQTVTRYQQIVVLVDYFPEGRYFQCILDYAVKTLCSWTTPSKMNTFKLFITYRTNGDTRLLCNDDSGKEMRTCSTDKLRVEDLADWNLGYVFTLQSCNRIVCSNQTFPFDSDVVKSAKLSNLRIYEIVGRNLTLLWSIKAPAFAISGYKLEYRMLGITWVEANTSSVLCYDHGRLKQQQCEFQLSLPCFDSHYEIRLYIQFKDTFNDGFWSQPHSIFFFTSAPGIHEEIDSACHMDFESPSSEPSLAVVLNELRQLKIDGRKRGSAVNKLLNVIKQKARTIKIVLNQIKESAANDDPPPPRIICRGLSMDKQFNRKLKSYFDSRCSYNIDQY